MRLTIVLTLLTAILSFADANALRDLFDHARPSTYRKMKIQCNGRKIEQCSSPRDDNTWQVIYTCPEQSKCAIVDDPAVERAECLPIKSVRSVTISLPEEVCKPGAQRCGQDNSLEKCGDHGNWEIKTCPQGETCDPLSSACQTPSEHRCKANTLRCRGDTIEVCVRGKWFVSETCSKEEICGMSGRGGGVPHCRKPFPTTPRSSTNDSCNPGDRICDANFYALRICTADRIWELEKKCTTPGDCKIDAPGQAHCERGGINPPKSARTTQQCEPRSRACDDKRRFLFTCDEQGEWNAPSQCFRDGYCKGNHLSALDCSGFPLYDGINETCDSHCESLSYLYCAGGSADRSRWEKCLKSMCTEDACKACDRCNYMPPYGGVRPDLSTLVPADQFGNWTL